jgi:hypothetical protein
MCSTDRQPLAIGPAAARIRQHANNRLGAVYSALYSFWTARHAAGTVGQQASPRRGPSFDAVYSALYNLWGADPATGPADPGQHPGHGGGRRDAYSVVLFSDTTKAVLTNDLTSNPDQLLDIVLREEASGGTNFSSALLASQSVMLQHWSTERFVTRNRNFFHPFSLFLTLLTQNAGHDFPFRRGMCCIRQGNSRRLSISAPARVGRLYIFQPCLTALLGNLCLSTRFLSARTLRAKPSAEWRISRWRSRTMHRMMLCSPPQRPFLLPSPLLLTP